MSFLNLFKRTKKNIITAIIISLLIYFFRSFWGDFALNAGMALGFLIMLIWPIIIVILCLFIFFLFLLIKNAFKEKIYISLLILLLGIICPIIPSYEERQFLFYRKDYENIVELAREDKLIKNRHSYEYPKGYEWLYEKGKEEPWIYIESGNPLQIEFYPRSFYRPLVYMEQYNEKSEQLWNCIEHDAFIWKKLDTNWFICQRDFN